MKDFLFTVVFGFACLALNGQVDEEFTESKIDSAWSLLRNGANIKQALLLSDELLQTGSENSHYRSTVMALQIKGEAFYLMSQPDSALYWNKRAFQLAEKNNDKTELAYTSRSMAGNYGEKGNLSAAIKKFDESLSFWKTLKDTSELTFTQLKKADLLNRADNHVLAMRTYSTCVETSRQSGDSVNMAYAYIGMGVVHKKQKNYQSAQEMLENALEVLQNIGDQIGIAAAKANMALVFKNKGELKKAHAMYPPLIAFYDSIGDRYSSSICMGNMSVCSNLMGNHRRARDEALEGIEQAREVGNTLTEIDLLNEVGKAFLALESPAAALSWSIQSKELADKNFVKELQMNAEETLSQIYRALGKFEESLNHHLRYTLIKDSVFQEKRSKQVLELQTLYETAERERKINSLEAKAKLEETRQRYLTFGLFALFILSSLVINREVKRRKKALQLHESERKLSKLEVERLEEQLELKKRELISQALQIVQKNEMLQDIKYDLQNAWQASDQKESDIKSVYHKINLDRKLDENWYQFMQAFTKLNANFYNNLLQQSPDLTEKELRLCALIKMNLSNKEIATMLNISDEGIKKARYRLRKKLGLDNIDNLNKVVLSLE